MSFKKAVKGKVTNIPGTRHNIQNAQLIVSTGIPSLDFIIGGGLPVGTIILVEEDPYKSYARVLLRYFLAEGIVCGHSLFVASQDENPASLIYELPLPLTNDPEEIQSSKMASGVQISEMSSKRDTSSPEMKIAWRYEKQSPINTNLSNQKHIGHYFNLSKSMDKTMIDKCQVSFWNGDDKNEHNTDVFTNPAYADLLKKIELEIYSNKFSTSATDTTDRNILRIGIQSIGSPFWLSPSLNFRGFEVNSSETTHKDLSLFFYLLRAVVRNAYAVAMVTLPSHLYKHCDQSTTSRIIHIVDTAVSLESFAGSERETNPIFKDYHGLFHVNKLSAINTLAAHDSQTHDLAFKLRRKKFCIEKLHLPPELQDSDQREQDDVPSVSCGSSSKHLLEF